MFGIMKDGAMIAGLTAPLSLRSNQPVFASDSLSLKRNSRRRTPQRWELEAGIEPVTTTANDLFALLVTNALNDKYTIMCPQNYGAMMKAVYKQPVTAIGAVLSQTVQLSHVLNTIPVGTMIQFESHDKVYMVNSLPDVNRSIKIFPPLIHSVDIEEVRWRNDVMMKVYLDIDQITGMVYSDGILMDMGVMKFVEAL